jgi:hypothetical protein
MPAVNTYRADASLATILSDSKIWPGALRRAQNIRPAKNGPKQN